MFCCAIHCAVEVLLDGDVARFADGSGSRCSKGVSHELASGVDSWAGSGLQDLPPLRRPIAPSACVGVAVAATICKVIDWKMPVQSASNIDDCESSRATSIGQQQRGSFIHHIVGVRTSFRVGRACDSLVSTRLDSTGPLVSPARRARFIQSSLTPHTDVPAQLTPVATTSIASVLRRESLYP